MSKTKRTSRVPLLLTPEERAEIEAAAEAAGLAVSSYIRMKVLEAARAESRERAAALREAGRE